MRGIELTAFDLAQRFVGTKEVAGTLQDNPAILAMLRLDAEWPAHDEVPWCSAFVNYVCWLLRLPRSKSLAARSWLVVGRAIDIADAQPGFDVVILRRADNPVSGHVAFFAGLDPHSDPHGPLTLQLLGGNQRNSVCVEPFPASRIVGVRRLKEID
jgi:uncharacterized protein (TIGR02594 family)